MFVSMGRAWSSVAGATTEGATIELVEECVMYAELGAEPLDV